jgi:predicted nucleotidyltransferase
VTETVHRGLAQSARESDGAVRADRAGRALDLEPIRSLLAHILHRWNPLEIWLFGSRARGNANANSDWDLLVIVPDETPDPEFDPLVAWRMRKECGIRADVVLYRASEFAEDRATPNTLTFEVATEGVRIHER